PSCVASCSSVRRAQLSCPSLVCPGEDDVCSRAGEPDSWMSFPLAPHPIARSKVHPTTVSRRCLRAGNVRYELARGGVASEFMDYAQGSVTGSDRERSLNRRVVPVYNASANLFDNA